MINYLTDAANRAVDREFQSIIGEPDYLPGFRSGEKTVAAHNISGSPADLSVNDKTNEKR